MAPQTKYIRYVPKAPTMKRIAALHVKLYRLTFGLLGKRVDGLDILLLTTVGKKTGLARTVPLPYFRDGSDYILIASFGGNDKNPAWYVNLKATSEVELQVGAKRLKARAEVLTGEARDRVWNGVTRDYPRYLAYQAKTERRIPVIRLRVV